MTMNDLTKAGSSQSRDVGVLDYLAIARFDHWTKQVFIIPGIVLAFALRGVHVDMLMMNIVVGFLSAGFIASANYVINEWLDRDFDAHHPKKSGRTAVNKALRPEFVYAEYLILVILGLVLAAFVSDLFLIASILFALSGLIYNVQPIRSKDKAYLDVLTEAINNPIRLLLGWAMVDPFSLPPSSLIFAYWMGGAFLMNAKRLSEYRDIVAAQGVEVLHRYRRSFRVYTEERLSVACFLYAIMSAFFIAVFLIKYRIEYILAFPAFAALFAVYLALSLKRDSVAQRPERLFGERTLMVVTGATVVALLILTFIDIPLLEQLSVPHFIAI